MDGEKLNVKVWGAYARAAKRVGTTYQLFRPSGATVPLVAANERSSLPVSLNANDPKYARPNVYGMSTWYAVADGAQLKVFDYLVGVEGTFFVAALQQLLPIFVVDCNRTISVLRVSMGASAGFVGHAGDTTETEVTLMSGWPASVLQGRVGEHNETKLPTDSKSPWWQIILPYVNDVVIRSSDIITDDLSRKYLISSAELTDMGWRITAMQQQA